ncbi:cell division protein FtsQ/DivIB [Fructilactobacillus florum]|uniref:Cell division protein FtsQ/DivIB C-terminal domain-containing protein n=1 Tax=Fructilactobacillus florum DSM 22689 = JCM 16035 TaxID=1423745 RepID=A0A0R2CJ20_9LACO|nr:cell division protein FtsQ/DivIB [Fructilactobacillus florum]KRM91647.1 hypothetical protein FC87_GL000783 [Fructilactobacillus florum DSM 22689 = JCM 16035]
MKEKRGLPPATDGGNHWEKYEKQKKHRYSRRRPGRQIRQLQKERHRKNRLFVLPAWIALLLGSLISAYFASPLSRIETIRLVAPAKQTELRQHVPFQTGDTLVVFMQRKGQTVKKLQRADPQVDHVQVDRRNWNHIQIKVSLFPIVAMVNHHQRPFPVYSNGKIGDAPISKQAQQPQLRLDGLQNPGQIAELIGAIQHLNPKLQRQIVAVKNRATRDNPQRVELLMDDGNEVVLGINQIKEKMPYYPDLKTNLKQKSRINLEFNPYSQPI